MLHRHTASHIILLMLAFGMALPASAQYISRMRIKEKNFCDTIPIEFRRGRIFIPVEIEGRTHQFIFDTGCSVGLMFTDRAVKLKKKFGFTIVNDAANLVHLTGVKRIPEMHIGHITVSNYRVVFTPGRRMVNTEYDCQQIVGCIGSDLVSKRRAVKIDTEKGIMVISVLLKKKCGCHICRSRPVQTNHDGVCLTRAFRASSMCVAKTSQRPIPLTQPWGASLPASTARPMTTA